MCPFCFFTKCVSYILTYMDFRPQTLLRGNDLSLLLIEIHFYHRHSFKYKFYSISTRRLITGCNYV